MLETLRKARDGFASRIHPGVYRGTSGALLPVDAALSLLAKRSWAGYRLWSQYGELTRALFSREPLPGDGDVDAKALADLRRDGCARAKSPYRDEEVAEARDYVRALHARARAHAAAVDPDGKQTPLRFTEDGLLFEIFRTTGRYRFHFDAVALAHPSVPRVVRDFAGPPSHLALVRAYFGSGSVVTQLPYYIAEVLEPGGEPEPWHIDCIRPTVKTYMILDDVGPDQAPLRIVPGTHAVDGERHRLFYRICRGGLGAAYFERADRERFDGEARAVTAKANSVLVFDNRAIHAGSPCRAGLRLILVNGYRPLGALRLNPRNFRDPAPVAYPQERGA